MSRISLLAAMLLTLVLPTAALAADAVELPTQQMSAEDRAAIDATAEAILAADPELPALYVGVWDPTRGAYVAAYGTADRETGRAASVDDHFRIGSISKTFTAAVILQLIDEGQLSLDDTVSDTDPGLAERFPALAGLTIAQLLGMQSGIPDYMNLPDAAAAEITRNPNRVWTADELIAFGVGGDISPPGTAGYSTTNYIALQEIAQSLTGQTLAELIAERLTGPLGMLETALPPNDDTALPEPLSRGYLNSACVDELVADGGTAEVGTDTTDWNASYGQGGGGMHSTIADLGTWAASLSGSSLLSGELTEARLDTQDVGLGPMSYGLGIIGLGPEFGHEGEAIGWEGWAGHDQVSGLTAVVFTNTCSASLGIFGMLSALDPAAGAAVFGN